MVRDDKRYGLFRADSSEGIVLIDIAISGFGEEINVYKDKELIATESTDDFDDYDSDYETDFEYENDERIFVGSVEVYKPFIRCLKRY